MDWRSFTMSKFKRPTRAGDQYQDLFGIDLIKEWLIDPEKYEYLEFEAPTADETRLSGLDDIVAKRTDGKFELLQIKFTVDSEDPRNALTFDWLLASRPRGTSILQKWVKDVAPLVSQDTLHQAILKTNRSPNQVFSTALDGSHLKFSKIPTKIKTRMIAQLGNEGALKQFCSNLIFEHSKPKLLDFEHRLESQFVPNFTNEYGWLRLQREVPKWATYKDAPAPDGKIQLAHIRQLLLPAQAGLISQSFYTPLGYIPPDASFHEDIMNRVTKPGVTVIWGTPGIGKSTYVSHVVDCLKKRKIRTARHHFFLSINDIIVDRSRFETVFNSVNHQISKWISSTDVHESSKFRKLIEDAANECAEDHNVFCLVVDGLDHVWRDWGEMGQLEQLFNHLLPLPKNVHLLIGTQKVSDEHLPHRLKTHVSDSDWLELPAMSLFSVGSYLQGLVKGAFIDDADVHDCTRSLFSKTKGHPLHLHYTVQEITDTQHQKITLDTIATVPECPEGDIQTYYAQLWARLSPYTRDMLHLIASSMFVWPDETSLYKCIGDQSPNLEAFSAIKNMLSPKMSGLSVFHESILVFVRNQEEHEQASKRLLPRIKQWLENDAPPYWKWAYLWLVRAKLGKTDDVIYGPTKEWLVDAFAKAHPSDDIKRIISAGKLEALKEKKLVEFVRLSHLFWRVNNSYNHGGVDYPDFLDLALSCSGEPHILNWMADNVNLVDASHLSIIAKELGATKPEGQRRCLTEMYNRLRFDFEFNSEFMEQNNTDLYTYLEIFAYAPKTDIQDIIIKFVLNFLNSEKLFTRFLHQMLLQGRGEEITALWLDASLTDDLKEILAEYTSLYFIRNHINISCRAETKNLHHSLAGQILLKHNQIKHPPSEHSIIDYHDGSYERPLIHRDFDFFYFCFQECLNTTLAAEGEFKFVKRSIPDRSPKRALTSAFTILEDLACHAAHLLQNNPGKLLNWVWIYEFMEDKNGFSLYEQGAWSVENAVKSVLPRIGIELAYLADFNFKGLQPPSRADIVPFEDTHWYSREFLISNMLKWQLKFLPEDIAVEYFLDNFAKSKNCIEEREEICLDNIKFALLYGHTEKAKEFLHHVSSSVLGYLWHKDTFALEVMDAIGYCEDANLNVPDEWLSRLEPIVNNINLYTNGRETHHAPSAFIELVAKLSPANLHILLEHYQLKEDWHYRDKVLEEIIKIADLSKPDVQALIGTISEATHLAALRNRADGGNSVAKRLLSKQIKFLGGEPFRKKRAVSTDHSDDQKKKIKISVSDFPPDRLYDFLDQFDRIELFDGKVINEWIEHWLSTDVVIEITKELDEKYENEDFDHRSNEYLWKILELSVVTQGKELAFKWAVRATIKGYTWTKYYSPNAESKLARVADLYSERWFEFIQETTSGGGELLVFFLIKVDEIDLAMDVTEALLCSLESDVAYMPLEKMLIDFRKN